MHEMVKKLFIRFKHRYMGHGCWFMVNMFMKKHDCEHKSESENNQIYGSVFIQYIILLGFGDKDFALYFCLFTFGSQTT